MYYILTNDLITSASDENTRNYRCQLKYINGTGGLGKGSPATSHVNGTASPDRIKSADNTLQAFLVCYKYYTFYCCCTLHHK